MQDVLDRLAQGGYSLDDLQAGINAMQKNQRERSISTTAPTKDSYVTMMLLSKRVILFIASLCAMVVMLGLFSWLIERSATSKVSPSNVLVSSVSNEPVKVWTP